MAAKKMMEIAAEDIKTDFNLFMPFSFPVKLSVHRK